MGIRKKFWIAAAGALAAFAVFFSGPQKFVSEAVGNPVAINSCAIDAGGQTVTVVASASKVPASDDGLFYLFAEPMYAGVLTEPAATAAAGNQAVFTVDLNARKSGSRLYSRFIVATAQGGQFVPVSNEAYITNPEAIATSTVGRAAPASKKGLLVDPAKLSGSQLNDLGVKHAAYNIPVSNILGTTTHSSYPTITYEYNGKKYQFNGQVVAEYDNIFKTLNNKGICVTAILLNNNTGKFPQLIHPYSRDGIANYYAFNTAEQAGVEYIEAVASFLGQRYSNKGKGKVDNWVIGNEVTAKTQWNYMGAVDFNTYVAEYAKSVRLFYNGLKSENANANVYVCIDQQWDRNRNDPNNYDGRDLLNAFNNNIKSGGDIDWGVACHPYPVPLTFAPFWANSGYYKGLVKHSAGSPFLTMENIEVLTDFMCGQSMLSPYGQVRSIIVSEVGYTAAQGEDMQAAAFVHGYLQAANNQHIDAFILSRQTDTAEEIIQGLSMGLTNPDGSHKLLYDYYKNIDTGNAGVYMDSAKAIMGLADWSQVLTAR